LLDQFSGAKGVSYKQRNRNANQKHVNDDAQRDPQRWAGATASRCLMIGYGAIATGDIQEGMKRLRECF